MGLRVMTDKGIMKGDNMQVLWVLFSLVLLLSIFADNSFAVLVKPEINNTQELNVLETYSSPSDFSSTLKKSFNTIKQTGTDSDNKMNAQLAAVLNAGNTKKKLNVSLVNTVSQNLKQRDDSDFSATYELDALPNYKLNSQYSVLGYIGGVKDLNGLYESRINDAFIGLRRSFGMTFIDLVADVPLSEISTKRDEKEFGLRLRLNNVFIFKQKIQLFIRNSISKNFHKFKFNKKNKALVSFAISNLADINYQMNEKFFIGATINFANGFKYNNNNKDTAFATWLSAGYNINPQQTIRTGVTNSGTIQNLEAAPDTNISFFEKDDSSVFLEYSHRL